MGLKVVSVTGPFESRQAAVIALQVIFISIALLVYLLRIYIRTHILHSLGPDDYIMGVAMLCSITLSINACISTKFGWGTHLYSIPPENFIPLLRLIWTSELLFTLSTSFVKLSILFFYLRVAVTITYRRVIYGSIALVAAWLVTFTCVVVFQCHPVSEYWNPTSTQCISPEIALGMHGITNTLTDIYVFVLPMPMVWNLHLPRRQRIGLLVIFGVGFLVCVAGALRLYYAYETNNSNDSPWEGYYLWTWEGVEVNLGIVCASAPCLKSLVGRLIPTLFSNPSASDGFWRSDGSNSAPAGAHQQLSVGRNDDNGKFGVHRIDSEGGYILSSIRTIGRDGKRGSEQGDSQSNLTDDQQILVVKSFAYKESGPVMNPV